MADQRRFGFLPRPDSQNDHLETALRVRTSQSLPSFPLHQRFIRLPNENSMEQDVYELASTRREQREAAARGLVEQPGWGIPEVGTTALQEDETRGHESNPMGEFVPI